MHWPALRWLSMLSLAVITTFVSSPARAAEEVFLQQVVVTPTVHVKPTGSEQVVLHEVITVPGSPWMRIRFGSVDLPSSIHGDAFVRLTSLHDGAEQRLSAQHLREWEDHSAYFNGSDVLIEIVVPAQVEGSARLSIQGVVVPLDDPGSTQAICGDEDQRVPTIHPAIARIMPITCTAWLLDSCGRCLATAGHCTNLNAMVVQFNVPLSDPNGSAIHPHPNYQFAVDMSRTSSTGPGMPGTEYGLLQVFPNPNTGLTPYESQKETLSLASVAPLPGEFVRVTGFGNLSPLSNQPPELNQTMRTHAGPVVTSTAGLISYQADTTGGNSGSPVIHDQSGLVVGLHTHGGCSTTAGNRGTSAQRQAWRDAIADPNGPCGCPLPRLSVISHPEQIVHPLQKNQIVARLEDPQSGMPLIRVQSLVVRWQLDAQPEITQHMLRSGSTWVAQLPAIPCGSVLRYRVEATTDQGQSVAWPTYPHDTAWTAAGWRVFSYRSFDFESNPGWEVSSAPNSTGHWGIAIPTDEPERYVPASDYDGSGRCWLTGVEKGVDVSGGPVRFTTQWFQPRDAAAVLFGYARYMASNFRDDFLTIEVQRSVNGPWTLLERVGNDPLWHLIRTPIRSGSDQESMFRVRFSVSDSPNNSITEAAIDAVRVETVDCSPSCAADLDENGVVDMHDLVLILEYIGRADSRGDINSDYSTDFFDYLLAEELLATRCGLMRRAITTEAAQ